MHKILLIGFGSLGYRYFEAISNIKIKKKIYIIDTNKKVFEKINNLNEKNIKVFTNFKYIPKKIDLVIVATTCNGRLGIFLKLNKFINFKNLIIEKPLSQSPSELIRINNILINKKNCWVNTDRRTLGFYKNIKKKINLKKKITMKVLGESWGLCCNSLHFLDLFSYLSNEQIQSINEVKNLKWVPSKRTKFYELDDGIMDINYGMHKLQLISVYNKKTNKNKKIFIEIKNGDKKFRIQENLKSIDLIYKSKKINYINDFLSIKMQKIIKKILLTGKSNLPTFDISSKIYMPLIEFFLFKWKKFKAKSYKVPIT